MEAVNDDTETGLSYYKYTELDPDNSFQVVYENGIPRGFKTPTDYRQSGYIEIQEQR
jgi:beta-glucanase (GH16 family)